MGDAAATARTNNMEAVGLWRSEKEHALFEPA